MKMKKIVCAMVSAALLVSMAAATAFAVESVPSKTGTDADAGKTDVSVSGSASSEGLKVEVKTTEDSNKEETQLKGEGVEKYLTAEAVDAAAKILGTEKSAVTVSEIKEIKVSRLQDRHGQDHRQGPHGSSAGERHHRCRDHPCQDPQRQHRQPASGRCGRGGDRCGERRGRKVRKVQLELDATTMINLQAGKAYIAAVTRK